MSYTIDLNIARLRSVERDKKNDLFYPSNYVGAYKESSRSFTIGLEEKLSQDFDLNLACTCHVRVCIPISNPIGAIVLE